MKKRILSILICCMLLFGTTSAFADKLTVSPVYGFEMILSYSDGMAVVQQNGKYGAIDTNGNMAIPCTFDSMLSFNNGYSKVTVGGRDNFVDKTGKLLCDTGWFMANSFSDGMAVVCDENLNYGYIDTTGKLAIPLSFKNALDFSMGFATVLVDEGNFGIIDKAGNITATLAADRMGAFSDGLAYVNRNGNIAFVNSTGTFVTEFFESAETAKDGMASVLKDGKRGFINNAGQLVIPCIYKSVKNFSGGYASVNKDGTWYCIDKTGKVLFDLSAYTSFAGFSEGYCRVKQSGKWGVIDEKGTLVVPCTYDSLSDCNSGKIVGKMNGQDYIISVSKTPDVKVLLNGNALTFNVPPQIIDGRTLVPLRTIFEAMQAEVSWDGVTQKVTVSKGSDIISFQIGNNTMSKNSGEISLDVAPQLIENTTFVPVRAISEAFSYNVKWDSDAYAVVID